MLAPALGQRQSPAMSSIQSGSLPTDAASVGLFAHLLLALAIGHQFEHLASSEAMTPFAAQAHTAHRTLQRLRIAQRPSLPSRYIEICCPHHTTTL